MEDKILEIAALWDEITNKADLVRVIDSVRHRPEKGYLGPWKIKFNDSAKEPFLLITMDLYIPRSRLADWESIPSEQEVTALLEALEASEWAKEIGFKAERTPTGKIGGFIITLRRIFESKSETFPILERLLNPPPRTKRIGRSRNFRAAFNPKLDSL